MHASNKSRRWNAELLVSDTHPSELSPEVEWCGFDTFEPFQTSLSEPGDSSDWQPHAP